MYNLLHFGKKILEKFQLQLYQLTFNFLNLIYVKKLGNQTQPNQTKWTMVKCPFIKTKLVNPQKSTDVEAFKSKRK